MRDYLPLRLNCDRHQDNVGNAREGVAKVRIMGAGSAEAPWDCRQFPMVPSQILDLEGTLNFPIPLICPGLRP
jgi:hypothetical protein